MAEIFVDTDFRLEDVLRYDLAKKNRFSQRNRAELHRAPDYNV